MPASPEFRLLTVKQVADRWQVSVAEVMLLIAQGGLRPVRISTRGKRVRICDIEAFEAAPGQGRPPTARRGLRPAAVWLDHQPARSPTIR